MVGIESICVLRAIFVALCINDLRFPLSLCFLPDLYVCVNLQLLRQGQKGKKKKKTFKDLLFQL